MADAKLPPFIYWRDGRPRFIPGRAERKLGFKGEDLRGDSIDGVKTGPWLTFEQAFAWGKAKNAEILTARSTGRRPKPQTKRGRSLADLFDDWLEALEIRVKRGDLSPATLEGYRKTVNAVKHKPQPRGARQERAKLRAAKLLGLAPTPREREEISLSPVTAINRPVLREFHDYARAVRGHHMANAMIDCISAAWTWGSESTRWNLGANPRIGMQFEQPPGRVMLIPLEQFHHLVAAADAIGYPSIGDSFYLGLWTGQRQTDRLQLRDNGLIDGRRHLVQSKTGVDVRIKEPPVLTARLDQARARVAALKLKLGTRPDTIVVNEATGLPFLSDTYRHWVAETRRAAVHGVVRFVDGTIRIADPDDKVMYRAHGANWLAKVGNQVAWILEPMPACADKRDQDLRDTCVILMFRAGVSIDDICEITGHSKQSAELIRKHYLGRNNVQRADAAIDALAAFVAQGGV